MKNPQTTAKKLKELINQNISQNIEEIVDNACCAFVCMWCLGVEPKTDLEAIEIINDAIKAGVIDKDCTVNWGPFVKFLTGREVTGVDFISINKITDIKNRTPVKFMYKGNPHWVGVEKGKIAFNSLENSQIVNLGRAVEKRVIHIKGVTE